MTMTNDDVDSVDTVPTDHEDSKQSRRDRLKGALSRTKTKINKVKEDYEAKRQQQQQAKADSQHKLDDEVDDFLSAGRPSNASSQRPTITSNGSDVLLSDDPLSTPPRPSTADSKSPSQPSPRRTPIAVPRIDVSSALRFPNAKEIGPQSNTSTTTTTHGQNSEALSNGSSQSSALLKPNYKTRSQSSSSLASANGPRRARLRGLSVGFADAPPVVIGEGGDEAEAPAIEISKAKERARSASPQRRKPAPSGLLAESVSSNREQRPEDDFVPKPFARTQTGHSSVEGGVNSANPPPLPQDDFVPKPFSRTQTGFSSIDGGKDSNLPATGPTPELPRQNPAMQMSNRQANPSATARESPLPQSLQTKQHPTYTPYAPESATAASSGSNSQLPQRIVPNHLPPMQTTGLDLSKEFEMTLGLATPTSAGSGGPAALPAQILAPKPKRAPPSYDLIEGGGASNQNQRLNSVSPAHPTHSNQQSRPQDQNQYTISNPHSRPPVTSTPQSATTSISSTQQQSQPRSGPAQTVSVQVPPDSGSRAPDVRPHNEQPRKPVPEYFPPPPHRTMTQTARIPQKITPVHHPQSHSQQTTNQIQSHSHIQQSEQHAPQMTPQHERSQPDFEYQTFAEHQRRASAKDLTRRHGQPDLRAITTDQQYQQSPAEYSSSVYSSQASAATTPGRTRFYESANKNGGSAPEGFF